jgi:glycosyltransferase involved in cell wall biosynthesis
MTAHFKASPAEPRLERGDAGSVAYLPASRRDRILVLAQLPPPAHGAATINAQMVNSRLLASRFDLDVVPISMGQELDRIRRFEIRKILRAFALYLQVARRLFGAGRPSLAYITLSPSGWAFYRDVVLTALLRVSGTRCMFHLHGRGVATAVADAPWKTFLYRFVFARAHVIVLGERLYPEIAGFVPRERVFIVPNGVADLRRADRTRLRTGAHLMRRTGPPKVLFLSNMLEAKGPFVLLEALAVLAGAGLEFHGVFAGAWRGALTPAAFAERVRALGLEDRVTHLGPVHGLRKVKAFMDADIFVLPTYYQNEALPLVVLEAMMHGLPVVTTTVGALPDVVAAGRCGELVEPRDAAGLARALGRLLGDPQRRARYGAAGRSRYEADLTDLRFEQRMLNCLSEVISS